jgi:hypothetical protein
MEKISGTTIILRLEGLALALACLWLYGPIFHQSWWLFLLLVLVPDLSMLGYLAGPKVGAALYNAVHSWVTFVVLIFLAFYPGGGDPFWLSLPFILGAHIGIDRALGFGLKHRTGFKDTHLGRLGKALG